MTTYDFRILLETKDWKQFSYISESFFNSTLNTNYAVSASDVWYRITGSLSCSYQNAFIFSGSNPGSNFNQNFVFKDNIYLSSSLKSGLESGSIEFYTTGVTGSDGDKLRRFKFVGEKVCTSLGIPHNLWQFTDEFRLVSGSEHHYFRGDVVADSLHVVNNMAISNLGRIDSDLPFKVDKQSDRFIKWQLSSASAAPRNDLLIGYNDTLDEYWISASSDVTFNIGGVNNLLVDSLTLRDDGDNSEFLGDLDGDTLIRFNFNANNSNTGDDVIHFHAGSHTWTGINMEVTPNQVIVNPYNQPVDFRVDGDTNDHLFFVSGTNEKIGLLNSDPPKTLTVGGDISASGTSHFGEVVELTGTDPRLRLKAQGANHPGVEWYEDSTRKWVVYNDPDESDNLTFKNDSTELMKLTQTGNLGIGTNVATKKLTVQGSISASGGFFLENSASIGNDNTGSMPSKGIFSVNYGNETQLSGSLSSTGDGYGDIVKIGSTTGLTAGVTVYLKSDGTWGVADATGGNTAAAMSSSLLGVALGANSDIDGVLLRGFVNHYSVHGGATTGQKVYIQAHSSGRVTTTVPGSSGNIVRVVGYCIGDDNCIYFNPDNNWITRT